MLPDIVIILRISGILFCLLHANNIHGMVRQLQIAKAGTMTIVSQISDNSLLLLSGALLILLSLKLQEDLQIEVETNNEPVTWPLPGFYLLSRPFVLALAILYLAIAPVAALEGQTIRNELVRPIDAIYIRQQDQISALEAMSRGNGTIEKFSEQLEIYLNQHNVRAIVLPSNLSEATALVPVLRKRADRLRARRIADATVEVRLRSNRIILQALLQALLLGVYWLNWPRRLAPIIRRAQRSLRGNLL